MRKHSGAAWGDGQKLWVLLNKELGRICLLNYLFTFLSLAGALSSSQSTPWRQAVWTRLNGKLTWKQGSCINNRWSRLSIRGYFHSTIIFQVLRPPATRKQTLMYVCTHVCMYTAPERLKFLILCNYCATHCKTRCTIHTATHTSTKTASFRAACHIGRCNTLQHTATHCNTLQHTAGCVKWCIMMTAFITVLKKYSRNWIFIMQSWI